MRLSAAIDSFMLDARARRLATGTIADYTNTLRKLQTFCGDPELADITAATLRAFLATLDQPQAPAGIAPRPARPLSKKTTLNIHIGLSAFYSYAVRAGLAPVQLMRQIPRPKPERRALVPFTRDEIKALLGSIAQTRLVKRNRALLLLLLDCGVRASELCSLDLRDYDAKHARIRVLGKGDKERILPMAVTTSKALNSYVAAVRKHAAPADPLFVSRSGARLTRGGLLQWLYDLGARAGVPDCHPHRFRHTFAIQYLRNGGDVYSLQMMLGHETLEMCRRYLALASADLAAVHQHASPVSGWKL